MSIRILRTYRGCSRWWFRRFFDLSRRKRRLTRNALKISNICKLNSQNKNLLLYDLLRRQSKAGIHRTKLVIPFYKNKKLLKITTRLINASPPISGSFLNTFTTLKWQTRNFWRSTSCKTEMKKTQMMRRGANPRALSEWQLKASLHWPNNKFWDSFQFQKIPLMRKQHAHERSN